MKIFNRYRVLYLLSLVIVVLIVSSCSSGSYSTLLKEEKKNIEDYIKREHIQVTENLPDGDEWDENLYYKVPGYDYLFFHLVHRGDSVRYYASLDTNGDTIKVDTVKVPKVAPTETVVMRYRKYTLTFPYDTVSYWNTLDNNYPVEFKYLTGSDACAAWHEAVTLMEYSDSECKIICPSKAGPMSDQTTVTPYGYHIRIKIKR